MGPNEAVIHIDAFARNLALVRERVGGRAVCVPVKADAYGHGAVAIAHAALECGAAVLAVARVEEGAALRADGIRAPIMLFSQALPEELDAVVELGLESFVSDAEFIDMAGAAALAAGRALRLHLKVDTGMGRLGCRSEEAAELASRIVRHRALRLAGMATHLARADSLDAEAREATAAQIALFQTAARAVRDQAGIDQAGTDGGGGSFHLHAANSGAVLLHPDAWFDMVRPGLLLYGYSPFSCSPFGASPQSQTAEWTAGASLDVRPVMELRSRVAAIRKLRQGERVSYGGIWEAKRATFIATIPLGYADGLPRAVSGHDFPVFIGGRPYPLVGRVCMDQCMVDLGPDTRVKRWDAAVFFGGEASGADSLAALCGTIPYEITCGVSARVPRMRVKEW